MVFLQVHVEGKDRTEDGTTVGRVSYPRNIPYRGPFLRSFPPNWRFPDTRAPRVINFITVPSVPTIFMEGYSENSTTAVFKQYAATQDANYLISIPAFRFNPPSVKVSRTCRRKHLSSSEQGKNGALARALVIKEIDHAPMIATKRPSRVSVQEKRYEKKDHQGGAKRGRAEERRSPGSSTKDRHMFLKRATSEGARRSRTKRKYSVTLENRGSRGWPALQIGVKLTRLPTTSAKLAL